MKLFATITGFLGEFLAKHTTSACFWGCLEEVETPESLLK